MFGLIGSRKIKGDKYNFNSVSDIMNDDIYGRVSYDMNFANEIREKQPHWFLTKKNSNDGI